MYKNPDTGYYEADFRRRGIPRLHISYGEKKKEAALALHAAMVRVFREKRTALIEQLRRGDVTVHELAAHIEDGKPLSEFGAAPTLSLAWPTLEKAADEYIDWLKNNAKKSKGTWRPARAEIDRFLAYAGKDTTVDQISADVVTAFQKHLHDKKYAQNTVVTSVWRVSGLFTWLQRREQREAITEKRAPRLLPSPIDEEEISTLHTRRERYLIESEAERLLAAAPTALLVGVMLGLLAGLRIEEMLHLRPQYDIDMKLELITIQEQPTWHPKNRKRRVVPMAPQLKPVIAFHLERYASEQWLLPSPMFDDRPMSPESFGEHFRRIVKNAELIPGRRDPNGVVYHTLRHTFASWLVMKGVDLYTVSQLLGNSLKMVEQTYAHLAPDFRQRAVDRLGGLVAIPALDTSIEEGVQS